MDITVVFISLLPSIFLTTKNLIRRESNIILHMKYTEYYHNANKYAGWPIALVSARRRAPRVVHYMLHLFLTKHWSYLNQPCHVQFVFYFFSRVRWSNSKVFTHLETSPLHMYQRIANGVLYSALMFGVKWLTYYRYGVKHWAFGKRPLTTCFNEFGFFLWPGSLVVLFVLYSYYFLGWAPLFAEVEAQPLICGSVKWLINLLSPWLEYCRYCVKTQQIENHSGFPSKMYFIVLLFSW